MDFNTAKGISLVGFFFITIVLGTIPLCLITKFKFKMDGKDRGHNVLSFLNCFAGGVFLGTCLLNMFTEGQEQFEDYKEVAGFENEYPFFQMGVGLGFFLIVFVDRLVHLPAFRKLGEKRRLANTRVQDSKMVWSVCEQIISRTEPADVQLQSFTRNGTIPSSQTVNSVPTSDAIFEIPEPKEARKEPSPASGDKQASGSANNNSSPSKPGEDSGNIKKSSNGSDLDLAKLSSMPVLKVILLLVALSFHTIFDGLAVSLQDNQAGVWSTFGGISIHKAIVAVCLGLELTTALPGKPLRVFFSMLFFALMAPLGVAIGMGVTSGHMDMRAQLLSASVLQSVATGSFLYVTFMEILGPELRDPELGVYKVMVATLGFAASASVKVMDKD